MHGEDAAGLVEIGRHDLGGYGDGMQVIREGDALYVGHFGPSGMGTSVLDASDLTNLRLVRQWRAPVGGHNHKVQVADGLLLTNFEAFRGGEPERVGMAIWALDDPFDPKEIGFWDSTGAGVHRIVWEGGRYAYVSATPEGYKERIWVVIDLDDPAAPIEAGRWEWPGVRVGEDEDWPPEDSRSVHHALVHGDRAYLGWWDSGFVILDISDLSQIEMVAHLEWDIGGHTHTALPLPGRRLVVVTDEAVTNGCIDDPHMVRIIDVADERSPQVLAICPVPQGDFCERGLRFGAHCLHENRPGTYRSEEVIFVTYFNAGLRVYDIAEPDDPVEIAHWIPECPPGQQAIQINDCFVDTELNVYATDRVSGGVYVLRPDADLARRMDSARV